MMSLTFGLFTQVSGSGPLGPLVIKLAIHTRGVKLVRHLLLILHVRHIRLLFISITQYVIFLKLN